MINSCKSIILAICMSLLVGCVAVFVAAGAAAGMVVYDKRTLADIKEDTRIAHSIQTTFGTLPKFRDARIVVVSFNQTVLLLGETPNPNLTPLAVRIARQTEGVRRVYHQLRWAAPCSLKVQGQDALITTQVRSLMLNKKGLESGSIRVVTEEGVVYLMGMVTQEQANLAVDVARRVSGVRRVVKVFQYQTH